MFCPKCGTQLNDGVAFCNACGANLKTGKKASGANFDLLAGKKVSVKDSNFILVAIAGILAFFATVLMHCPVISAGQGGQTSQMTLLGCAQMMEGEGNAVGQIIFTILVFFSLAYLFLPYIKGIAINATVLNYAVPAFLLTAQSLFFLIACIINPMGEAFAAQKEMAKSFGSEFNGSLGLSMDGWLYWLSALVSIGLLVFVVIKNLKAKK